jgi:hypothetical protein
MNDDIGNENDAHDDNDYHNNNQIMILVVINMRASNE